MTIDIDTLRAKVLAIKNGELPEDAVTEDELREALNHLRTTRATAPTTKSSAPKTSDIDLTNFSL